MKKIILVIAILFFFPITVNGYCSPEEKVRLNNIAKNLDFTYDYYYNGNKVEFVITITNLHPDIYIYNEEKEKTIYFNKNLDNPTEIAINEYAAGGSYKFYVLGYTNNCRDEYIMTHYRTVPAYNGYSLDPICVGAQEFDLCQRWKSAPISYEKFLEAVKAYKESKAIVEDQSDIEVKGFNYYFMQVLYFIDEYYIYYVSAMILVLVLMLLLRKKDNFKLE